MKKLKGYVAKNFGEYDITNMSFCKTLSEAKTWKGQEICEVEIILKNCFHNGVKGD